MMKYGIFEGLLLYGCICGVVACNDVLAMDKEPDGGFSNSFQIVGTPLRELTISNIKQFRGLTEEEARELESVTFENIELSKEFVYKFWDLFSYGVDNLTFVGCYSSGERSFADLFDYAFKGDTLKFFNANLTLDDIDDIFAHLYPYSVGKIVFSEVAVGEDEIKAAFIKRQGHSANETLVIE